MKYSFVKYILLFIIMLMISSFSLQGIAKRSYTEASYNNHPILISKYAYILNKYVSNDGIVDYYGIKKEIQYIDMYLFSLKNIPESTYNSWNENQKIAFWSNAYNAITLKIVAEHYPINTLRSKKYPKNSIKQLPGVWKRYKYSIINRKLSLDNIENEILEKEFPGIKTLFTIVKASKGSAPLRNEPFDGSQLDSQVADQVRKFLNSPENFQIDIVSSTVLISPIFKWHENKFLKKYGNENQINKYNKLKPPKKAVMNFINNFLDKRSKIFLYSKKFSVEYLSYDWSLNDTGY